MQGLRGDSRDLCDLLKSRWGVALEATAPEDTLDEAHNDAQQLVLDRLKKKADYVQRLEGLFSDLFEGKARRKGLWLRDHR